MPDHMMITHTDTYQGMEDEVAERIAEPLPPRFTILDRDRDDVIEDYMEIIKAREQDSVRAEQEIALREIQTFTTPRIENIDSDELKLRLRSERDNIISRRNVVKLVRGKDDRHIALAVREENGDEWYLLNIITNGEHKGKINLCGGLPSRLELKLTAQGTVKLI